MKRNAHLFSRKKKRKPNKEARANRQGKLLLAEYEGKEVLVHAVIQRISSSTVTRTDIGRQPTMCVEAVRIVEENGQRKKLCSHMWLHFAKIKNTEFVRAHARPMRDIMFRGIPETYFFEPIIGKMGVHKYGFRDIVVTMIGMNDYVEGVGEVRKDYL